MANALQFHQGGIGYALHGFLAQLVVAAQSLTNFLGSPVSSQGSTITGTDNKRRLKSCTTGWLKIIS